MERKTIFCIFFTISLIFGNTPSVLIIRPDTYSFKKFEIDLKKRLKKDITVQSVTPRNQPEMKSIFENNTSQLVVVLDKTLISYWKELHNDNQPSKVPSIFIGSEFDSPSIGNTIKNNCTIFYRTSLDQYIDKAFNLAGKKPQRIGILYSFKYLNYIQTFKKDCNRLNAGLFPYAISASNPESNIKSSIKNMLDIKHVDLLILPDDPLVLNSQNIKSFWDEQLKSIAIPVAVPPAYLSQISRTENIFSLQQDLSEITDSAAKLICDVKSNNWMITRREIYANKSICLLPKQKLNNTLENQNIVTIPVTDIDKSIHSTTAEIKPIEPSKTQSVLPSDTENEHNSPPYSITQQPDRKPTIPIIPGNKNVLISKTDIPSSKNQDVKVTNNISAGKSVPVIPATENKFKDVNDLDQLQKITSDANYSRDANKVIKNIQITSKTASVFRMPSPGTPLLGIARSGDKIAVYSEDSTWLHIDFFGIPGYLLKSDSIQYINQPRLSKVTLSIIIFFAAIIILIAYFAMTIFTHRNKKAASGMILKKCLLITGNHQRIKYSSGNEKSVLIKKFIKNFGYQIKILKNSHSLHKYIGHHSVDLIIIDFSVDHYIQSIVSQTLMEGFFPSHITFLFYNATNITEVKQNFHSVHKLFVFNSSFTVSELNKVLLMTTINESATNQSSHSEESYLQGIFHKDTLLDIFQMIDTGKKTGCLLVDNSEISGVIFFEDGIITYAMSNILFAEEAVFKIISQKTGSFRFISDKKPLTQHLCLDIQSVLLEKARIDDETTHTSLENLMNECSPDTTTTLGEPITNSFDSSINNSQLENVDQTF